MMHYHLIWQEFESGKVPETLPQHQSSTKCVTPNLLSAFYNSFPFLKITIGSQIVKTLLFDLICLMASFISAS